LGDRYGGRDANGNNAMKWWPFARKSASAYDVLRELSRRRETSTGKIVNYKTAIEVSTVLACLRVLSEGIAQVPLKLMQDANGKREPARKHPLYDVLATRPNPWQTSFEYREMLAMHVVLCGNHYSFVSRSVRGEIMELIPFEPGTTTVTRQDDGALSYQVRSQDGKTMRLAARDIWHVRGPSWNSWMGLEAVTIAREAIGLAMSTEEQQARMHKNGVQTSGVYSIEGTLSDAQYKQITSWLDSMTGSANAGKSLVLDRGAKWLNQSMTGVDAQTLESRRFQVEEICRFFRVNPIMVGAESKNTTYASAEQMFLAHLVHTLAPWYMRLEQSIDANLLTDKDRAAGLYANFVEEGLLRGSATTTQEVLVGYVNGGLMTPNEGRAKLDMNPDPDPASDQLRIPTNLVGAAAASAQPVGTP